MAKINKTNIRKKTTKNIEKERIINVMKANINAKTNNPNFTRVFNLTGIDRKTLKRWWDKREEYASSRYKNSAEKLGSEKYTGKFLEMENDLDAWAQELREAGCCLSGFTLKVKALEILRKLGQFDGKFLATDGWLRGFLHRKNYTLRRITTTGRDLPKDFLETINQFHQDCALNFIDDDEFDPNTLVNMDETSIYIDKPSTYTFL
jgi:hypothetical protein